MKLVSTRVLSYFGSIQLLFSGSFGKKTKWHVYEAKIDLITFIVFNATFSNISAISWRPVLVVEEAGVPGENHQPWGRASNW